MRIFIITMDDPIMTHDFIKHIIQKKREYIVGLAVSQGDRLKIGKHKSKLIYVISLFLIMGPVAFSINSFKLFFFKLRKRLSKFGVGKNPSILTFAKEMNIPVWDIKTPNSKEFLKDIKTLSPDIIINQSQSILKSQLLEIPSIGIINRHNALLPKNRGRLTPFWVLYKGEMKTGVSIHFVTENIDAGDIIVQLPFGVDKKETFNSLVRKNYKTAKVAIIEAIELLEKNDYKLIPNLDDDASYNSIPTLKDAIRYRLRRFV